jgi:predicted enzyme related to lactoylglutathione lyase
VTTRLVTVVVDSLDTAALARFWSALLQRPITAEGPDEVEIALTPETDLLFGVAPEGKTVKNRVHLDLASTSTDDQAAVVQRAIGLGAHPVDIGQGEVPWTVLADPEGNEFCVLEPREEYLTTGPLAAVVVDAADPSATAAFWSDASGLPLVVAESEFASLRPRGGPWLEFVRVTDPRTVKNRLHLDVAPESGDDQAAEVARLVELGARPVDVGQGDVPWTVLADPEGNEFCVLTPR